MKPRGSNVAVVSVGTVDVLREKKLELRLDVTAATDRGTRGVTIRGTVTTENETSMRLTVFSLMSIMDRVILYLTPSP